jgi:hypothetical protein
MRRPAPIPAALPIARRSPGYRRSPRTDGSLAFTALARGPRSGASRTRRHIPRRVPAQTCRALPAEHARRSSLKIEARNGFGLDRPWTTLRMTWEAQLANLGRLQEMVAFNQIATECQNRGLDEVAEVACAWEHAPGCLVSLFERCRLSALLQPSRVSRLRWRGSRKGGRAFPPTGSGPPKL